jgi:hypothetical protein
MSLQPINYCQEHYKIAPPLRVDSIERGVIERALEKIQGLKSYQWCPHLKRTTREEALEALCQDILEGVCRGAACALLNRELKEGELPFSLQNRLVTIDPEEVIYRQICHHLRVHVKNKEAFIDKRWENKQLKIEIQESEEGIESANIDKCSLTEYREKKLKKYREEERLLSIEDFIPLPSENKNKTFCEGADPFFYQTCLEKAIGSSDIEDEEIRGVLSLPEHVMPFQYGPQEYLIYDSFSSQKGGLFKYPDKESFFIGMRRQARRYMREADFTNKKARLSFVII